MLLGHAVSVIAMNIDPKVKKNISEKVYFVILWIIPLLSLFICNVLYGYNLGFQLDMGFLCGLMIGVFYLILGNFIPKVKPNYTIGFRISWALCDPENWYRTHRFGGKCMVIGGIIMIVTAPFQNMWILIALILVPCILPVIYSYLYLPQDNFIIMLFHFTFNQRVICPLIFFRHSSRETTDGRWYIFYLCNVWSLCA